MLTNILLSLVLILAIFGYMYERRRLHREYARMIKDAIPTPTPAERVPDPSGMRATFHTIKRGPLLEISEDRARQMIEGGSNVFGHPFDPIPISHFDANGFQCWAREGYRFEAVRYYTDNFVGVSLVDPEALETLQRKARLSQ